MGFFDPRLDTTCHHSRQRERLLRYLFFTFCFGSVRRNFFRPTQPTLSPCRGLWRLHHFQLIQPYFTQRGPPWRHSGSLVKYWAFEPVMPMQCLARRRRRSVVSSSLPRVTQSFSQLISYTMMALAILLVFIGGAVGSMWRYGCSLFFARHLGEIFPFGTLAVNLIGSILIGVFAGLLLHIANDSAAASFQQLLMVGICGGLTTFSSFSLQTYILITSGKWLAALLNIILSTGLSFGCVALGWQATQGINF